VLTALSLPAGQDGTDYSMRIFNSDGSEPEMCGNGIRCLARFVAELSGSKAKRLNTAFIRLLASLHQITADGQVRVDMGVPRLQQ